MDQRSSRVFASPWQQHHQQPQHRTSADAESVPLRPGSANRSAALNAGRPRSMFVSSSCSGGTRDLSPSNAPLWRNAPTHHHHHLVQVSTAPPASSLNLGNSNSSQQQPQSQASTSISSFQQSLRSYPGYGPLPSQSQPKSAKPNFRKPPSSQFNSNRQMSSAPGQQHQQPQQQCHVTSLEGEEAQSTPFFLDYLDSQSFVSNPTQPSFNAFDHHKFMEMFREPVTGDNATASSSNTAVSNNSVNHVGQKSQQQSSSGVVAPLASVGSGSLPYSVNNDDNIIGGTQQRDSLLSQHSTTSKNTPTSSSFYLRGTTAAATGGPRDNANNAHQRSAIGPRANASGGGGQYFGQQQSVKEPVILRRNREQHQQPQQRPTAAMENKNSRSTSNLNQRLMMVAERRAQIDEAKRERVQRQIEQVARTAPPPLPGLCQNPSVAFGSTRPRNIDLTRPLVNPVTPTRPKSEIFFGGYGSGGGGQSVTDSPSQAHSQSHHHQSYSKDDTNYQTPRANRPQPQSPHPSMTQSMSSHSFLQSTHSSSNSAPTYRAIRRHDPELMPAAQKYIFREYASPSSSGTPSIRKENSGLMSASMTSTKSYQVGGSGSAYRTPFGVPLGSRPKKSYSMNRLDQLAQPRRRVEPKVPTSSSSFMKPFTTSFSTNKRASMTEDTLAGTPFGSTSSSSATAANRGVKPTPPPKNLFNRNQSSSTTPRPTTATEPLKSATSRPAKPAVTPRPRPLSQIEPISKTAQMVSSSPVVPKATAQHAAPAVATPTPPAPTSASTPSSEPTSEPPAAAQTQDEADKLAEYKRALAEKKAMFRKQQEEKPQVPVRRAKIVKPEVIPDSNDDENQDDDHHSSSSSSSSSSSDSSDSESDNEKENNDSTKPSDKDDDKLKPVPQAAAAEPQLISIDSQNGNGQTSSVEVVDVASTHNPAATTEQQQQQQPNLMTTSLIGDMATLSLAEEKAAALSGASMTASFDASLLSNNSSGSDVTSNDSNNNNTMINGQTTNGRALSSSSAATAAAISKQQLEERSAQLLLQERLEREKRKSRVLEILNRTTRKDGKKDGDQGSRDGGMDSSSNGGTSPNNGEVTNGNGIVHQNGTSATTNGHGKYQLNGHNGTDASATSNGKAEMNGNGVVVGNGHHQDMKNFVTENEQSLPPTNGF